jgi:malonyl-CoA reductase/3-hydroxypropionate dehydrogenase (NADP+)
LRLERGGYLSSDHPRTLSNVPAEPFFANDQIEKEARKVGDGIKSMLFLNRMPTEFDVALATVHYLADTNVSGETFHPSGGLRFERTVTEGELFGKASPAAIGRLRGTTVYLIGEYLRDHLTSLIRAYLEECDVARVVVLTETDEAAYSFQHNFPDYSNTGRFYTIATHGRLEESLDRAYAEFGRPGPVVCTPFYPLPVRSLAGTTSGEWDNVLNEDEFVQLVENNLTHHFRVAQKISLVDGAQLVLVTPSTTARSTAEEYALANFIKTSLHAFTATLGVESERVVHNVPVNQVDLARRARTEEPRNTDEESEELLRFVNAVLLTSAPQIEAKESRYRSRIYRGNAITV